MKLRTFLSVAALAVVVATRVQAGGAGSDLDEPFALGLGAATAVSGAVAGAAVGALSFDVPVGHPLSIMIEPSVSWVSSAGGGVLQLTMAAVMRFYLISPFVPEDRQAHWGPFIAGGAAVSWARQQSGATPNVIAFGPNVEAGYRLVFGDHGIFLEPAVAWMMLYGARLDPGGPSAVTSNGLLVGLTVGYRF